MKYEPGWGAFCKKRDASVVYPQQLPALRSELPRPFFLEDYKRPKEWIGTGPLFSAERKSASEWLGEKSRQALLAMQDYVEADSTKLGGVAVLRGTRFSITQLLAEIADSDLMVDIADDFDLMENDLRGFLHALAVYLNRPMHNANRST